MKKAILIFIFSLLFIKILISQESINELLKIANNYYIKSHFDKAINYYSKIIEMDPEFAVAYYNRGKAYEYQRKDYMAVKDFIKAIKLKKEYANILMNLGTQYYHFEEYDRALFYYISEIKVNPDNKKNILIFLKRSNIFKLLQKFKIKVTGKTEKIKLICKIPDNYDKRQIIYKTDFSLKPLKIYKSNNNKYIEYILKDPTGDYNIEITNELEILPYDFNTAIQNKNRFTVKNSGLEQYLISEKYLEKDDPAIQRTAKLLNMEDEVETVKRIYNFVLKHMKYRFVQGPEKGAVYALKNRGDDCSEYTDLLVTLCRANNIPARTVSGLILTEGELNIGHAWPEVYFKEYGWIPFDPTFDDTEGKKDITNFENLSNVYIYLNFTKNDKILNNKHVFFIEWWGDKVDYDYDVFINNSPKENYFYFYNLIYSYKSKDSNLFLDSFNILLKKKESFKDHKWEYALAQYFTDNIEITSLINLAENNNSKLCEAYCYIAYKFLFDKKEKKAKEYFNKCIKIKKEENFELLLAKSELNNLK